MTKPAILSTEFLQQYLAAPPEGSLSKEEAASYYTLSNELENSLAYMKADLGSKKLKESTEMTAAIFTHTVRLLEWVNWNRSSLDHRAENAQLSYASNQLYAYYLILIESLALEGRLYLQRDTRNGQEKARVFLLLAEEALNDLKANDFMTVATPEELNGESYYQMLTQEIAEQPKAKPRSAITFSTRKQPSAPTLIPQRTFQELYTAAAALNEEQVRAVSSIYGVYEQAEGRKPADVAFQEETFIPSSSGSSGSSSPEKVHSHGELSRSNSGSPTESVLFHSAPALIGNFREEDSIEGVSVIYAPEVAAEVDEHGQESSLIDNENPNNHRYSVRTLRSAAKGFRVSTIGRSISNGAQKQEDSDPERFTGERAFEETIQNEQDVQDLVQVGAGLPSPSPQAKRDAAAELSQYASPDSDDEQESLLGDRVEGDDQAREFDASSSNTVVPIAAGSQGDSKLPPSLLPNEPAPTTISQGFLRTWSGTIHRASGFFRDLFGGDEAAAANAAAIFRAGPPSELPPEAIAMEKAREEESARSSTPPAPSTNQRQPIPVPFWRKGAQEIDPVAEPVLSETIASHSEQSSADRIEMEAESSSSEDLNRQSNAKPSSSKLSSWLRPFLPKIVREKIEDKAESKKKKRQKKTMQALTADRLTKIPESGGSYVRGNTLADTVTTNAHQRQNLREMLPPKQAEDFAINSQDDVSTGEAEKLLERGSRRSSYGSTFTTLERQGSSLGHAEEDNDNTSVFGNFINTVTEYLPDNPFANKRHSFRGLGDDKVSAVLLSDEDLRAGEDDSSNASNGEPNTTLWYQLETLVDALNKDDWLNWLTYEDGQMLIKKLNALKRCDVIKDAASSFGGKINIPIQMHIDKIDKVIGFLNATDEARKPNMFMGFLQRQGIVDKKNVRYVYDHAKDKQVEINLNNRGKVYTIVTSQGHAAYTITVNEKRRVRFEMRKDGIFNTLSPAQQEIALSEMSHAMARMARGRGTIDNLVGDHQGSLAKNFKLEGIKKQQIANIDFFKPLEKPERSIKVGRTVSKMRENIYAQDREMSLVDSPRAQYLEAKRAQLDRENPHQTNTFMRGLLHVLDDVIDGEKRYLENVSRSSSSTFRM